MADNIERLSPENLQKLGRVIDDAKSLMSQQLEILDKILLAEEKIATTRIGHLTRYFDIYSAGLDKVASRHSDLDEAFLVANKEAEKYLAYMGSTGGGSGSSARDVTAGRPSGKDRAVGNGDDTELTREDVRGVTEEELKAAGEARKRAKDLLADLTGFTELLHAEERDEAIKSFRAKHKQADQDDIFDQALHKKRMQRWNEFGEKQLSITESIIELHNLQNESVEDKEDRITAIRLTRQQQVLDAEIATQKYLNDFDAQVAYYSKPENVEEEAGLKRREDDAAWQLKKAQALSEQIEKDRARRELYYKRKNNGILKKEDAKKIEEELKAKYKTQSKNEDNLAKQRARLNKIELEKNSAAERDKLREGVGALTAKGASLEERKEALYNLTHNEDGNFDKGKAISAALVAVSDLATQLEKKIDDIAGYKGAIDTRLQGSGNDKFMGSYWDQLVRDMTSVGAVNPFFKQETFANNIQSLVNRGISFDLKQRAFLMTIQDKIANTFDVADGTLLRLVRIQQQDSTAGRLGMETALNSFLNEMYETSEYLTDVAKSVRSSLEEMQALMEGAEAAEVEYQVQKWLGSLYSVGMSQSATQGIADALGKIAAGQIEGLTNGGAGNLLIMAANDAGLSIADILTDGLDSKDTNKLLQAAVNYLAELSESAADNKVVQQQLADVFGVKASDLRAATNLVLPGTTKDIYGNNMTYGNMISQLSKMAGSMGSRTSMAEMMTNFWENGQYTLAGSMASNPVSYFIYKMAKVVDDAAGGIDLPFLNVMGFGVDLNTTVSDLMRVAAVGGGILGSLGPLVSGLGSSFSGRAMLNKLGIGNGSGLATVTRGGSGGGNIGAAGGTTSESGGAFAGNSSGSDVKDSTIQESEDSKKQQMIEAKEEEEANKVDVLNQTVLQIYEILNDVANGDKSFKVKVEGYGLTKAGSSSTGALGGVNGAGAAGGGGISNAGNGGGGSANGGGVGGSLDLGGWTMI